MGDYVDGYDNVKAWPIAFIQEYKQYYLFMDPAKAADSMAELAKRGKRLDSYTATTATCGRTRLATSVPR